MLTQTLFVLGVSFSKNGRYLIVQSQDDGVRGYTHFFWHASCIGVVQRRQHD